MSSIFPPAILRFCIVFLCALAWAVLIVGIRYGNQHGENTLTLLWWTSIFALGYWFFVLIRRLPEVKSTTRFEWKIILLIALVGACLAPAFESLALRYGTAAGYSFLSRTSMLFTFTFAFFILGERMNLKKWIIAGVLLTGTTLVVTDGHMPTLGIADLWTLAAAASIALGNTVLGKIITRRLASQTAGAIVAVVGIVPLFVFVWLDHAFAWPHLPWLALGLGIVGLIGVLARFSAYRIASAGYISMVYSFTPLLVAILAFIFLGETITATQMLGGALVIGAGVLAGITHK